MLAYRAFLSKKQTWNILEWQRISWNKSVLNFYKNHSIGPETLVEATVAWIDGKALNKSANEFLA